MLLLTIKLDDYREDLFKDYLSLPLETNGQLKKPGARASNAKARSKYLKWTKCLANVLTKTVA